MKYLEGVSLFNTETQRKTERHRGFNEKETQRSLRPPLATARQGRCAVKKNEWIVEI